MPYETPDIESSKVKIGLKTLITIIAIVASSVWGIGKWIDSFKQNDSDKFISIEKEIDAINDRIHTDSMLRDQRLKDFNRFYGKDTVRFNH